MESRVPRLLLTCLLSLCWLAASAHADWVQAQWNVMGTRATLEFWPGEQDSRDTVAQIQAEFDRINGQYSPWREGSELYQANHTATQAPMTVSEEFAQLIETSRHYTTLTDGAFDISFATVGHLYDYRAGIAPDDDTLAHARDGVGMDKVTLDEQRRLRLQHPATRIDLGGIAKGHAIDRAVAILHQAGVRHAYISLGGDSYVLGDRRGRAWQVGIRHPRRDGAVAISLPLEDIAVSTSGDYERFFIRDGEHVHHILSPASGKPAGELVSVTVLAERGIDADALSTSLFVLGREQGLALANRLPGISAILIDRHGEVFYSDDLIAP